MSLIKRGVVRNKRHFCEQFNVSATVHEVAVIYLQNVPSVVSLSTAAVPGVPDGCKLAVLGGAIEGADTAML